MTLPQKSDAVLIIYSCITNDPKIYKLKNVLSHSFYGSGIWEQLSEGKGVPFGASDSEPLSRLQPGLKSSQGSTGEGSPSRFPCRASGGSQGPGGCFLETLSPHHMGLSIGQLTAWVFSESVEKRARRKPESFWDLILGSENCRLCYILLVRT